METPVDEMIHDTNLDNNVDAEVAANADASIVDIAQGQIATQEIVVAEVPPEVVQEVVADTTPEVVKESVPTEPSIKLVSSVSALLSIVLTSELSSLGIPLDKTTTTILIELLKTSPKIFDNTQELVKLIVQDGKLNANDLPQLYKLITELYPLVKNSKLRPSTQESAKIVGTITKVVIHVLVNEHKIKVKNQTQFLHDVNALIDAGVELLSLAKKVKLQTPRCLRRLRL